MGEPSLPLTARGEVQPHPDLVVTSAPGEEVSEFALRPRNGTTSWPLRRVTPATLKRIHATIRAALDAALRERLIGDNPARYVELPPARRPHAVL